MTISSFSSYWVRQLALLVVAVSLAITSYPLLHPVQVQLMVPIVERFWPMDSTPVSVAVRPSFQTMGDLRISEQGLSYGISRSAYSSSHHALEDNDPLLQWLAVFRKLEAPVAFRAGLLHWQPAKSGYKTLLYYHNEQFLLDAITHTEGTLQMTAFDRISRATEGIPIDLFGGGYLLHQLMPAPVLVDDARFADFIVDQWNPIAEQYIRERRALDENYWIVTPIWLLVVSGGLILLPWWLLRVRLALFWPVFAMGVALVTCSVLLLVFYRWWLPVLLPLFSLLVSAVYRVKIRRLTGEIQQFVQAYLLMAERWVHHLLDEAKPEMALRFLTERQPPISKAQLWLDTGQAFERNREIGKAQHCYQTALQLEADCTEARSRLRRLTEVIDGSKTIAIVQGRGELPIAQITDLTLGRYKIQREIGRGAMGIVYEAIDPKINRHLALKVVHLKSLGLDEVEQVKQRFFREAQAAGKLNHPHIVTVYDVGEEHDVAYIAMDLLQGNSLAQHIQQESRIDLAERVLWIAQAAEALGYAHQHDVIHRDVKPANMLIDQRLRSLKLTDFGVARIAGVHQTQTGIVLGSPSFMSPEQIRGEPLTGLTDIFSLGVTLYQAITGVLPFTGDTLPALAYSITQSKQASPRTLNPDVPVSLVRIVNKALQKSTQERYQSGDEFAQALRKWLAERAK